MSEEERMVSLDDGDLVLKNPSYLANLYIGLARNLAITMAFRAADISFFQVVFLSPLLHALRIKLGLVVSFKHFSN